MSKFSQVIQEIKKQNRGDLEYTYQTILVASVGVLAFLAVLIFAPPENKIFAAALILFPILPSVTGLTMEWSNASRRILSRS